MPVLTAVILVHLTPCRSGLVFFFFNDTATTEIYTLSLHDALPILAGSGGAGISPRSGWRRRGGGPACGPRRRCRKRPSRKRWRGSCCAATEGCSGGS